jgi:hypothetical protein
MVRTPEKSDDMAPRLVEKSSNSTAHLGRKSFKEFEGSPNPTKELEGPSSRASSEGNEQGEIEVSRKK